MKVQHTKPTKPKVDKTKIKSAKTVKELSVEVEALADLVQVLLDKGYARI